MEPLFNPFKATALALFIITAGVSSIALADTATELNAQAKQYYDNKDYRKAFNTYKASAEQGNAQAMAWVGNLYDKGKGVPKNMTTAIEWYTKAANAGNSWSMDRLGDIYRKGEGVTQDYAKAMGWYQKAADAGHVDAMTWIGVMYGKGQGVPKNTELAVKWYLKAANLGNKYAMKNLAGYYKKGKGGLSQDYTKAMQWYRKAADAGDADSMYSIGFMYAKGQGVSQDYAKAMQWYRKSAQAGNSRAMRSIGMRYRNGEGVPKDYSKAMEWYKKSAEAGYAPAMASIGIMYKEGEGVSQNYPEAVEWFKKAVATNKNYTFGYMHLGHMYGNGYGVIQSFSKAREYYQKAIDIGDEPYALAKMGELYNKFDRDTEAVTYYKKAAEVGSDIGMSHLALDYEYGSGISKDYNQAAYWYSKSLTAEDKASASHILQNGTESNEQYTLRKLENLLTTGKITDPTIRKQVEAIFAKPPLITWQTTPPTTVNNDNLTLSVKLTDQGEGIGEVRLLLDGTAIDQSTRGLGRDVNQTTRTFNLTVPKGKHTLTVQAYPKNNAGYSNDIEHTITSTYQPVQKPKIHAVVVGIDSYEDPSLNLKFATTDANAMYQALLKQTGGIYDKGQLTLLNTKANTTKRSIETALENITKTAQMNDVFVFYAASHGYNYPSLGYYLFTSEVSGTSDNAIKRTGLSADDLQDLLAQVKTNKKLILLDSCASGDAINARDLVVSNRGLGDQMAADVMKAKSGAMVMMASSSQQQAIEGYQGHGLFTYSVLQGLKGKADMNKDGWTQTGELKMFVEDDVQALSKRIFNQVQNPKASSDGDAFGFKVF